jgi:hypothetical protein
MTCSKKYKQPMLNWFVTVKQLLPLAYDLIGSELLDCLFPCVNNEGTLPYIFVVHLYSY